MEDQLTHGLGSTLARAPSKQAIWLQARGLPASRKAAAQASLARKPSKGRLTGRSPSRCAPGPRHRRGPVGALECGDVRTVFRRSFSLKFGAEIAEHRRRGDRSIVQVATDYVQTEKTVGEWVELGRDQCRRTAGLSPEARTELSRLCQENRQCVFDNETTASIDFALLSITRTGQPLVHACDSVALHYIRPVEHEALLHHNADRQAASSKRQSVGRTGSSPRRCSDKEAESVFPDPIGRQSVVNKVPSRRFTGSGHRYCCAPCHAVIRELLAVTSTMGRQAVDVARRRFAWGSAAGIVVSTAAFAWMVTGGTFQFFRSVPFSNFYDVQARSLLHGTFSMPANVSP